LTYYMIVLTLCISRKQVSENIGAVQSCILSPIEAI